MILELTVNEHHRANVALTVVQFLPILLVHTNSCTLTSQKIPKGHQLTLLIVSLLFLLQAKKSVYFYVFEHRPDISKLPELTGAFHGDDIGFVFGAPFAKISPLVDSFTPRYSDIETGLSRYIMKLWTNFAKFG